jgi:hypothetical protein
MLINAKNRKTERRRKFRLCMVVVVIVVVMALLGIALAIGFFDRLIRTRNGTGKELSR